MSKCRFLRCLVCALVICSLIFNYAAIPAKAVVGTIALGTVTGAAAAGVAATLFAVAMGVVCVGLTYELIVDIGQNLRQSGINYYQNDTEKQTQWTTWIDGLEYDLGGGGGGTGSSDGDPYNDPFLDIAGNVLVYEALQNWGAKLMQGEGIETEGEAAPEGYVYYGDYLAPSLSALYPAIDSSKYPYFCVFYSDYFKTTIGLVSELPLTYYPNEDALRYDPNGSVSAAGYRLTIVNGSWRYKDSTTPDKFSGQSYVGDVYYNGTWSDASSEKTTIVQPSIYVGDIPQKIQNGEADEDDIVIPDIDYSKIFEGHTDAVTALDQVANQLANGTITYDQYLEMTKPQIGTGTGSNTGTGTDVWNPPQNPGQFALDLSNYFPFCIPFDLYDFFSCLNADPVAPVIHWEIALPGGSTYPIELDLSPFDSVAQLLRRLQLLLFIVGLAIKTRDIIKG